MADTQRKLSEILKEMADLVFRSPEPHTAASLQVALFFANMAWNESVGMKHPRENYRSMWEKMEEDNPTLWNEFKSNDVNAIIDNMLRYKMIHYPDDRRRIHICGFLDGKVHVEWLDAAKPRDDPTWEMRVFGLVRMGRREEAIRFLQDTLSVARQTAEEMVEDVAAKLAHLPDMTGR